MLVGPDCQRQPLLAGVQIFTSHGVFHLLTALSFRLPANSSLYCFSCTPAISRPSRPYPPLPRICPSSRCSPHHSSARPFLSPPLRNLTHPCGCSAGTPARRSCSLLRLFTYSRYLAYHPLQKLHRAHHIASLQPPSSVLATHAFPSGSHDHPQDIPPDVVASARQQVCFNRFPPTSS